MKRTLTATLLVLVAGCARSEEASTVTPTGNQGYNQTGGVNRPEQDDQEPAIGEWRTALQENATALEFGPMGTGALFSLLCTGRQSVLVQSHGGVPGGTLPEMQLTVGDASARLPVTAGGGAVPMVRAEVPLNHPLLQAMARSDQPLTVTLGNDPTPLILPHSALVGNYLTSCTDAPALPAGNSSAPASSAAGTGNGVAPTGNGAQAAPAANTAQPRQ